MRRGVIILLGLSAFALSACSGAGSSGTPSQQLHTWVAGTGLRASTTAILTDMAHVNAALGSQQPNAVQTTCSVMANDADAANSNLPSPNEQVSTLLSDAYSQVGIAANDCFIALKVPANLTAYRAHESQARGLFAEAATIIEAQTGQRILPAVATP